VSVESSVEPDAWDQADLAWHGLFYLVLLFPAALMTFADPVTDRWPLMWALVVATVAWHAGLTLPGHRPGVEVPLWRGLLALTGSCAGVLTLFEVGDAFT
jgi:hypothetical protein